MLYDCSKGLPEKRLQHRWGAGGIVNEGEGCNELVLQKMGLDGQCVNTFDTYCPKYKTWNS